MLKKLSLLFLSLALAAGTLCAQSQDYKRWFADAGLGLNAMYDNGKVLPSFGSALTTGFRISPEFAVRLQIQAGVGRHVPGDWFTPGNDFRGAAALDIMMDPVNLIYYPKLDCFYHAMPYLRMQETFGFASGAKAATLGFGAGMRQSFRISNALDVIWDMNAILSGENTWKAVAGGLLVFGQMTFGVGYNF